MTDPYRQTRSCEHLLKEVSGWIVCQTRPGRCTLFTGQMAALYLDHHRNEEAGVVLTALRRARQFPQCGMENVITSWRLSGMRPAWMGDAWCILKIRNTEGFSWCSIRRRYFFWYPERIAHTQNPIDFHSLQKDDALKNVIFLALAGVLLSVTIGFWSGEFPAINTHINTLDYWTPDKQKNLHFKKHWHLLKSHEDNSRMMKIVAWPAQSYRGSSGLSAIMLKEQSFPEAQRECLNDP